MATPVIALMLQACTCADNPPPDVPEVLIVTVDTLRADRLGFAGHAGAHTPTLDALAASGRVFAQATTPLPRTTPALGSLHTGLWPHHHGAREVGERLMVHDTLAAALASAGWRTAGISAIAVAGPDQGMDAGFDSFEVQHDVRAADVVARALELAASEPERPLMLWVHLADPHFPYLPPDDGPLQPEAPRCRPLAEAAESRRFRRDSLFADRDGKASAALEDCRLLYDAEVAAVDAAIGTLLEGWRSQRGTDGLVVFSADHGENQGERGLFFEHGPNVSDASLRVPMVLSGRDVVPGTDAGVARLEDLMPTVLAWAGLPVPAGLDGVDLAGRLRGEAGGPTMALAESGSALHVTLSDYVVAGRRKRWCVHAERFSLCQRDGRETLHDHLRDPLLEHDVAVDHPDVVEALRIAAERWPPESGRERTARDGRFKLVGRPVLAGGYAWSLYDVAADPGETTDVTAAHPDDAQRLMAALDGWDLPRASSPDRDDDVLEALRALGYVEP